MKAVREESISWFSLATGGSLSIFDILWLVDTLLQSLPSSSHGVFPVWYLSSDFPFLQGHESHWIRGYLILHLTSLCLQERHFQIKSHSKVLEVMTSTYKFERVILQPLAGVMETILGDLLCFQEDLSSVYPKTVDQCTNKMSCSPLFYRYITCDTKAFRNGRSTIDHCYTLSSYREIHQE